MRFSDMPYTRPDLGAFQAQAEEAAGKIARAASAGEQEAAFRAFDQAEAEMGTATSLAYIRHTMDTRDEFYDQENDYADRIAPAVQEAQQKVGAALLASPFRRELEGRLGALLFTNLEIAVRSFHPGNMALMQEENRLQSQYQKLYASALAEWRGQRLPLPQLGPYKQSLDRTVRRAVYEAEGRWFDSHREELDALFDQLVKNRTAQARNMGYDSFLPLGYDRLGRNCYGSAQVAALREQIARDLVPIAARVKEGQRRRLGVGKLMYWDDTLLFPGGNALPQGTAGDLLAAGRQMYRELSPETAEFADFLWDNGLLDVLSRKGKAPGGYCTELRSYRAPFIFSNFNGTSGDVDVLTHEAGHAFAAFRAMGKGYLGALLSPTMEACEVHSMSMEFLTAPWHGRFFGPTAGKYEVGHCEDALTFLPYGCLVDEFQHRVYEDPGMTAGQRNRLWLELEGKYRPWMDFGDLPFYSRGSGWQRQLHIYLYPFYYIDYCMAQAVAFQFWLAALADRQDAWGRYLRFVDAGGTKTFEGLVAAAGLQVPYAEGCIREVGQAVAGWLEGSAL